MRRHKRTGAPRRVPLPSTFICAARVCDLSDQPNIALPSMAPFFLPPLPPDLLAPRLAHHSKLIMVTTINTSDGEPSPDTNHEANGSLVLTSALPSVRQGHNSYRYGRLSLSLNDTIGVNVDPLPPLAQSLPSDCPDHSDPPASSHPETVQRRLLTPRGRSKRNRTLRKMVAISAGRGASFLEQTLESLLEVLEEHLPV